MIIGANLTNLNGTQVPMDAFVGVGWDRDHARPTPAPNGNSQLAGSGALGLPACYFDEFITTKLFLTEKTLGTLLARIPAVFLSVSLSATPSSATFPFLTMI